MRLKFVLSQAVWNTSGIYSPNLLQYHYDLNVFRCKAPPGSCAAGTQFPELDHKGSDFVLNCISIADILICREDDFMVSKVCGVILGFLECGGYFWLIIILWIFHYSQEFEREKHAHSILQFQFMEIKEALKQREEMLAVSNFFFSFNGFFDWYIPS